MQLPEKNYNFFVISSTRRSSTSAPANPELHLGTGQRDSYEAAENTPMSSGRGSLNGSVIPLFDTSLFLSVLTKMSQ